LLHCSFELSSQTRLGQLFESVLRTNRTSTLSISCQTQDSHKSDLTIKLKVLTRLGRRETTAITQWQLQTTSFTFNQWRTAELLLDQHFSVLLQ